MPTVTANGDEVVVHDGASVEDLLHQLGLAGRTVIVERNGEPVARTRRASTRLEQGDRLELVRAVAGG